MSDFEKQNGSSQEPDEKYEDRKIRTDGVMSEKLQNFWFFHRGKVIAGVVLLLVAILFVSQMVGRRNSDVMLAYSGPVYLSGEDQTAIQDLLSTVVGKSLSDETLLVGLTQYQVYSKAQIESLRAETHEDGEQVFVNSEYNSQNYENLYTYIMTGDTAILFLDPWLYNELRKNERLLPMNELFGTLPAGIDEHGYGITLSETEIYRYYGLMQKLPAETVMCFLKPQVIGKTSKEKNYTLMKETFCAIVNFDAPN